MNFVCVLNDNLGTVSNSKISKSGDTVTGRLRLQQGYYVHSTYGTSGTSGYVRICRFTITGAYCNSTIAFKVHQRRRMGGEIKVLFNPVNGTDPDVQSLKTYGDLGEVIIVKADTSIWDLYICKSEGYDTIDIVDFQKGNYQYSAINVEWCNDQVNTAPTGTVATKVWTG